MKNMKNTVKQYNARYYLITPFNNMFIEIQRIRGDFYRYPMICSDAPDCRYYIMLNKSIRTGLKQIYMEAI